MPDQFIDTKLQEKCLEDAYITIYVVNTGGGSITSLNDVPSFSKDQNRNLKEVELRIHREFREKITDSDLIDIIENVNK